MCKAVCEQTEEGRALWDHYRETGEGWKQVSEFHRNAVLNAIREEARKRQESGQSGGWIAFYCARHHEEKNDGQGE